MMKIIQLIRGDMKQIRRDSMLAVYFIPLPWQLFGVFTPTYWTAKTYLAGTSSVGFVLVFGIIGVVLHMMILLFLYHRFLVKTDQ
ncbi:hypothetical protein [Bacillus haynesii]|uniref:hypothetical protein n=1 Tax=Bacillus haynesii TaxID=1925021 RepID=UPI0015944D51|nr:hypothetical protein [Bacillus haynesii]NVB33082.1 hypothetical protein [Bacillus licheniformis]MCY7779695.1 hypothetical protein [Bacillus haynesii]MCY7817778.1 hypothetical protein [Bacillus haynesii]MCY8225079.1 hypothetical protein [Bacillus haynesii]MCY8241200.1 hypothetical protein [Bacillus haynesii]